jgi:BASS family bile acid:Na+ symporter
VAPALLLAVAIQNTVGYLLGYAGARLLRLNERDARTVAIEVGLQNAGMASGLALTALKSTDAGLAPAIFGPWMNASGSVLASFWRRRPTEAPPS